MAAGISFRAATLDVSLDNAVTWLPFSAYNNKIDLGGGDRPVEDEFVTAQDYPLQTIGKRAGIELTWGCIYTEGTGDPEEVLRAAYEAGNPIRVRYTIQGNSSGNFMYTTDAAYIQSNPYPKGEAGSGKAILIESKIKTPRIVKSVIV
jgi:hypothetical protein